MGFLGEFTLFFGIKLAIKPPFFGYFDIFYAFLFFLLRAIRRPADAIIVVVETAAITYVAGLIGFLPTNMIGLVL